jgi:hypothetical protein
MRWCRWSVAKPVDYERFSSYRDWHSFEEGVLERHRRPSDSPAALCYKEQISGLSSDLRAAITTAR